MVPVTAWAVPLVARVSLCTVAALEERAWELLVTAEEELLLELEERACEPLLTEELPDERVVTLLERVLLVPEDRVALLPPERELLPVERLTCWLLPEERLTCELLPEERVVLPEDRLTCWLLPLERVVLPELEDERLLEELLPLERVVVVPPPEREERD